ncbi:MAG: hypothetical protein COS39_07580 [Hydrogenophilales bacterium CG03_land_8_20_14_0_80_62_28]|nr:hypothetical protein [Betaproteobacteria bacterium]OIO78696.1 MAG: hypothetical protein AUJ86_04045 [Hydrogenophilaceae bacterium CG1_02_62_390]PIV22452.1 MAG: hypothetical protein COS39_07580 [Hydrogenophilales bacterium CG03_land_8_20_14_0_80_62_28]PIW38767.1 MAG: hypothetical protein COW23_04870 [Hydrogenophilales bacterium CG15_BIG_FIL_POST_REV_8_21_14_020_62_31]PIW72427.1 MAG: hypothetical protein COW07_03065 [Hydrogenophilales bacterium CG12_big_fil_rev_8_21_14_0_65_61_21]PIX00869.1 M
MTTRTHFTTLAFATALAFAAAPAFAHDWDGNSDLQQSILNDHTSGFVGTGFSSAKPERGVGDTYGQVILDVQAGDIKASAGPEKGIGDNYGSVLNDL